MNPLDFEVLHTIGKGPISRVRLVKRKKDGEVSAWKILCKDDVIKANQVKTLKREITIHCQMKHSFITRFLGFGQTKGHLYLNIELCPGGELFKLLRRKGRMTLDEVRFYSSQVILALAFLRSKGVVFRDLKPENILIDKDGYIKLSDFGCSKQIKNNKTYSVCGTPRYMAPEIIKISLTLRGQYYDELEGKIKSLKDNKSKESEVISNTQSKIMGDIKLSRNGKTDSSIELASQKEDSADNANCANNIKEESTNCNNDSEGNKTRNRSANVESNDLMVFYPEIANGYGYSADYWSLGVLIYEMIAGIDPFAAVTDKGIQEKILRNKIDYNNYFDEDSVELVSYLLRADHEKRLGVNNIKEIMKMKFFSKINFSDIEQKKIKVDVSKIGNITEVNSGVKYDEHERSPMLFESKGDPFIGWFEDFGK
eukprot:CAMPEP_0170525564 /NCGR_PEP_ID=MMETSP0209-20121228/11004_1 /TAXON_ID=665100 ORGANISM="Litonotus pictus, Strain P1" /NCGR_SAMPLE_ID=MMETSP0209 /ASSEMBLY_ACC=CAM_ASM_000301 /LENGTH=425 /DNA_ID=CAMNT_0010814857 /DNA_START=1 /DNA_END=1278 /DNA_ORIENTATION=+